MPPESTFVAFEDLLYLPGDIMRQRHDSTRRYFLESTSGYLLTLYRLNEDGSVNERLRPLVCGLQGWMLIERPTDTRFVRIGNTWKLAPNLTPAQVTKCIDKAMESYRDLDKESPQKLVNRYLPYA